MLHLRELYKQINHQRAQKERCFYKKAKDFVGHAFKKACAGKRCVTQRRALGLGVVVKPVTLANKSKRARRNNIQPHSHKKDMAWRQVAKNGNKSRIFDYFCSFFGKKRNVSRETIQGKRTPHSNSNSSKGWLEREALY